MQRFWNLVNIVDTDNCWEFTGYKWKTGYGCFWLNGKSVCAHRAAYLLTTGVIPDGLNVCHTCDNPTCCNPRHLFLGTQKDNMHDRNRKNRANNAVGERNAKKLTWQQVCEIRGLYSSGNHLQKEIAAKFNIAPSMVSYITRKSGGWREAGLSTAP